jgi:ABC-2 type transport system permease protein
MSRIIDDEARPTMPMRTTTPPAADAAAPPAETFTPPVHAAAPAAEIAAVRVAGGSFAGNVRAMKVVWQRELIRFARNRLRILTSLAQPVLFLFVLGTGLSTLVRGRSDPGGFDFRTFMFPGIIAMTVLFTAVFSAVSIVWDREFGFLREILVAPVNRSAIILGKAFGGATVATAQGIIMLALAGFVHVPYSPLLILSLVGEMALTAFMITAVGLMLASRIQEVQAFQVVIQFFVMPMFFLSGAMFPLSSLPKWLAVLTKIDPLTYAVDPMRRAVFSAAHATGVAQRAFSPGVTWAGWHLPIWFELVLMLAMAVLTMGAAVWQFSRSD